MGLDTLLAKLKSEADTPDTLKKTSGYQGKALPLLACTFDTPDTPQICNIQSNIRRWLLHFADREPLTVAFSPAATHAEVLAIYPDALAAEPDDEATIDDVLTLCRHDDDARVYYLGRAGYAVTDDDRRCCSQCRNLRAGVCTVARPGGRVSAIVGYRPASPDMPQRCAGYAPNANDTNQRAGREHWPGLIQKGCE
ncbi:MAG: hypothetical protein LK562_00715 [Candidatus Accumulibacter phosphatis]|nr:hypothetical protein [Candidatus Accumulibacter phosphatis]